MFKVRFVWIRREYGSCIRDGQSRVETSFDELTGEGCAIYPLTTKLLFIEHTLFQNIMS